jgi:ABC-type branched-subunit amino acid transport system ATPase component
MDIVFSFADRISVLVNGALLSKAPPEEVAADPSRESCLSRRGSPCLSFWPSTISPPATARRSVLSKLSLSLDEGQSLRLLGRNGMGKTTLVNRSSA